MTSPTLLIIREAQIELQPGERYAGIVLAADGLATHHLVLLLAKAENLTWTAALDWAAAQGGELPTRQEQSLLFANLKAEFEPEWYWSGESYTPNGAYAWGQSFGNGGQINSHKSYEGHCRAVRRFTA